MLRKNRLRILGILIGGSLIAETAITKDSADISALDIQGAWTLVEWHHEGHVLRPPDIGGAYFLANGQVTWAVFRETVAGETS